MKKIMLAAAAAFCAASVSATTAPQPCLPFTQVDGAWVCLTGAQGAGTQENSTVIRSEDQWKTFWAQHAGAGAAPAVDFSKNYVVTFQGGDAAAFKAVKVAPGADAAALKEAGVEAPSAAVSAAKGRVAAALSGVRAAEAKTDSVVASANSELASIAGFDGARAGLRDAVASPVSGAKLIRVDCTPGVDCPSAPAPAPSNCTPGVDCPTSHRRTQSSCTPGVDCDNSAPSRNCTPGVDCPNDNGSPSVPTPAPDNYYPRPSDAPSTFPDWHDGSLDRFGQGNSVTSDWMTRRDFLGDAIEDSGSWSNNVARGTIERAGSEKGTQGTRYHVTLISTESRDVYRLYWRYKGYDCDPNDSSRCRSWHVQQAWFWERTENGQSSAMNIVVEFHNDKPLLPWETETINLTYNGTQVGVDDSYGAFQYAVRGPIIDQQNGVATLELTPTARRMRAPEFDKVQVNLENKNGYLMMKVDDQRANFYAGENIELVYQVMRKCSGWWECTKNFGDVKVYENNQSAPMVIPVQGGQTTQYESPLATINGSGTYYLNWYFRRANSKISDGSWSGWKATPKVQH